MSASIQSSQVDKSTMIGHQSIQIWAYGPNYCYFSPNLYTKHCSAHPALEARLKILCMVGLLLICIYDTLCQYALAYVFGNAQYVCLLDLLAFTCCDPFTCFRPFARSSPGSSGARGFTVYNSGAIARRGHTLITSRAQQSNPAVDGHTSKAVVKLLQL